MYCLYVCMWVAEWVSFIAFFVHRWCVCVCFSFFYHPTFFFFFVHHFTLCETRQILHICTTHCIDLTKAQFSHCIFLLPSLKMQFFCMMQSIYRLNYMYICVHIQRIRMCIEYKQNEFDVKNFDGEIIDESCVENFGVSIFLSCCWCCCLMPCISCCLTFPPPCIKKILFATVHSCMQIVLKGRNQWSVHWAKCNEFLISFVVMVRISFWNFFKIYLEVERLI